MPIQIARYIKLDVTGYAINIQCNVLTFYLATALLAYKMLSFGADFGEVAMIAQVSLSLRAYFSPKFTLL